MTEDKVLPDRVERYVDVGPDGISPDFPGPNPEQFPKSTVERIAPDDWLPQRAAPTVEPDLSETETGGSVGLGAPAGVPAPAPREFPLNGHVGQFFMLKDHWVTETEHARAILDAVWPFQVRLIPPSEDNGYVEMLHFVAFCSLFRKLKDGEMIPGYVVTTQDGQDGIEVYAAEQPMPDRPKIVVPSRKERREMERYAKREQLLKG